MRICGVRHSLSQFQGETGRPEKGPENGLANPWSRKKITKKPHTGRGHEANTLGAWSGALVYEKKQLE
jgi:hypothetical protein